MNYQYKIQFYHPETDWTFYMESDSLQFVVNYIFALKEIFRFKIFLDDATEAFVQGGTYLQDVPFWIVQDMYELIKGINFKPIIIPPMTDEEVKELQDKYTKEYEYQL